MDTITTAAPTHSLRERMLQDMTMRGFGAHTQKDYIRHVRSFAAFLGRPPDTATMEDLRRYQVDQHERAGAGHDQWSRVGTAVPVRDHPEAPGDGAGLVVVRYMPKLRVILSIEETARLLEAAPGIKYKAALSVAYGAGLRVSEVAHLKVDDIDSTRMMIRVEQGKGRKDRNAMLTAPAGLAPSMVARRQAARSDATSWLVVPRPQRHGSGLGSPVAPRRAGSGRARRDPQAGKPAYTAPLVRHSPARAGRRYPGHPGAAGTREHQHDRHLHQVSSKTMRAVASPLDQIVAVMEGRAPPG
jgi:integrase